MHLNECFAAALSGARYGASSAAPSSAPSPMGSADVGDCLSGWLFKSTTNFHGSRDLLLPWWFGALCLSYSAGGAAMIVLRPGWADRDPFPYGTFACFLLFLQGKGKRASRPFYRPWLIRVGHEVRNPRAAPPFVTVPRHPFRSSESDSRQRERVSTASLLSRSLSRLGLHPSVPTPVSSATRGRLFRNTHRRFLLGRTRIGSIRLYWSG